MSGAQQFDSGGVIHRARAVLTFSAAPRIHATALKSASTDTPTPDPVSFHYAPPQRGSLPILARAVAPRGMVGHALLRPIAGAVAARRRARPWPIAFAALGLVTLASSAALGMRSLSEERGHAVAVAEARVFEASATESASLAWALPAPRIERPAPVAVADTPRTHAAVAARPRDHVGPSHRAGAHWYALAHAARPAPSTALARRAPAGAGIRR